MAVPIYEFFCNRCNTIFNFLSRRINTTTIPSCPKCSRDMQRRPSLFSTIGKAKEASDDGVPDIDESRMERVLGELAQEAENISEDDPRQMARVMRKFTEKTGISLGDGMEEALTRMEAGEDPDKIEQELGDVMEGEDSFFGMMQKGKKSPRSSAPFRDETLYEL